MGFGSFVHWSMDPQLASVINHSMLGTPDDSLKISTTRAQRLYKDKRYAQFCSGKIDRRRDY